MSQDTTTEPTATRRRSRVLVWATIAWNTVEAVVAVAAGAAASSGALLSFGLDSAIEVSAAVVALWYLGGEEDERGELAGRLIGASFWALAAWVTFDAVTDLVTGDRPDESVVGIVLTAVSVVVMPALAVAKRRTAMRMGSAALVAESNETMVCAYLSVAVLTRSHAQRAPRMVVGRSGRRPRRRRHRGARGAGGVARRAARRRRVLLKVALIARRYGAADDRQRQRRHRRPAHGHGRSRHPRRSASR